MKVNKKKKVIKSKRIFLRVAPSEKKYLEDVAAGRRVSLTKHLRDKIFG